MQEQLLFENPVKTTLKCQYKEWLCNFGSILSHLLVRCYFRRPRFLQATCQEVYPAELAFSTELIRLYIES